MALVQRSFQPVLRTISATLPRRRFTITFPPYYGSWHVQYLSSCKHRKMQLCSNTIIVFATRRGGGGGFISERPTPDANVHNGPARTLAFFQCTRSYWHVFSSSGLSRCPYLPLVLATCCAVCSSKRLTRRNGKCGRRTFAYLTAYLCSSFFLFSFQPSEEECLN